MFNYYNTFQNIGPFNYFFNVSKWVLSDRTRFSFLIVILIENSTLAKMLMFKHDHNSKYCFIKRKSIGILCHLNILGHPATSINTMAVKRRDRPIIYAI